jgi:hypothetical protein
MYKYEINNTRRVITLTRGKKCCFLTALIVRAAMMQMQNTTSVELKFGLLSHLFKLEKEGINLSLVCYLLCIWTSLLLYMLIATVEKDAALKVYRDRYPIR